MMKNRFTLIVLIVVTIQSCKVMKRIPESSRMPASSSIPEMFASIDYESFESTVAQYLIQSPISLKIDTVMFNTIIAYELYDGNNHRQWFFWETTWTEKTVYTINYEKDEEGVFYKLEVESFEAPSENYSKWQSVYPSRKTKEELIINKLNNNGTK